MDSLEGHDEHDGTSKIRHITAETLTTAVGVGGFALYKILIIRQLENHHPPTPLKIVGSADVNNVTH